MNKKWFEIFKKYRARKYLRDFNFQENDFARRGLEFSSERTDAQKMLKADYDDEVAMKSEEVDQFEEGYKENKKAERRALLINFVEAGALVATLIVTTFFNMRTINESEKNLTLNQHQYQDSVRPYLTFVEPTSSIPGILSWVGDTTSTVTWRVELKIVNVGSLPARFVVVSQQFAPFDLSQSEIRNFYPTNGVIMPNQEMNLGWFITIPNHVIGNDRTPNMKIFIGYSKINDRQYADYEEFPYGTVFEGESVYTDKIEQKNASWMRWKISSAK
ncbi:MAG: hypothetical protein PHS79_01465 [Patescibacteria group bacterium]|nr:hypothetical protein [Patescibacteria group bacterium]